MQLRLPADLRKKITRIAGTNHLSEQDVVRLLLAQTLPTVERSGLLIQPTQAKATPETAKAA